MAYLTCTDLTIGYGRQVVAEHISFSVGAHDLLCVIGHNGAGKSTLVKTLLGIVSPLSGKMTFGDKLDAREVGYLPQQGEQQRSFPASVWEIVLSGRLSRIGRRPFFSPEDRMIAQAALERVQAQDLKEQAFARLSGGQRQRVLLARALCAAERLIVLDEPTSGLDPIASAELYETLDRLREEGLGIIVVSHDVDEALSHADFVLSFDGSTPSFATAAEWLGSKGANRG